MDCSAQFSRAKKAASGIIRANAVVVHSLNRTVYSAGDFKANATVDVNVGFTPPAQGVQFGSRASDEMLFGSSQAQAVTRSDNRFSCSGNIRFLKSKQFKLPNQNFCSPVNTVQDLVDIKNDSNILTIDVQNPYCELGPLTSATEVKNGDIYAFATFFGTGMSAVIRAVGNFRNLYVDKIAGSFDKLKQSVNFEAAQKLYPTKDITISKNNVSFVNKQLKASGLYESIDEGVYVGANHILSGKISNRVADDAGTFIQPSSIYVEGEFTYKCEISKPLITPIENFLFIRAAAPIFSYASEVPAEYKIHNIKFEDPSGNLIVKYKDINFRGDGDYRDEDLNNFATYITEPEINYAALNTWSRKYPIFGEASGYTLSMDFSVNCLSTPFTEGFSKGYESDCKLDFVNSGTNDYLAIDGAPLSTRTQGYELNPDNSIRISAIEISAKGFSAAKSGLLQDNYLGFYTEVVPTGNRIERRIFPSRVLPPSFETYIDPSVNTVWKSVDVDNNIYDNTTESGIAFLTNNLRNLFSVGYIQLDSTSPVADSGKLKLRFDHEPPFALKAQTGGAFNFGAKRRDKNFNSSQYDVVYANDAFFTVDSIELHVRARKAINGRDYALDVVGYSDDGVVNVTSSVGGFLQNIPGGSGQLPLYSGFNPIDDLGIASESISDKFQYFETTNTNPGGDHYLLTQSPVVDSTEFKTYIVPLKIYQDQVTLGRSRDYTMSSYFEKLYVDIYPIPVGAAISRVDLVVKYKPINAIPLHTFGYDADELTQRTLKLYPSARKEKDNRINSVIQDEPLSFIENIPHAFGNDKTLKTNYSRRWRGVDGNIFAGPFDPIDFSFAFENPQLEEPFLNGHFKFRNFDNNVIFSNSTNESNDLSGIFSGYLRDSLIRNVGLRFKNESLFPHQTRYCTLDWTTPEHELHGQIIDAFENAVRVSGEHGHINFGNAPVSSGFAVFTRFAPDITISGSNYNLFNSGVVFSKWDENEELEIALGYEDGHICGYAKNSNLDLIKIKDPSHYSSYQYPLSVLLTYNDNNSHRLKLYTDNEIVDGGFDVLRDSSEEFVLHSGNSNLTFGYSSGSGVGINAFITEVGISTSNASGSNIRESGFDSRLQQTTAESFLSAHRAKFWNTNEPYTNDRFSLWDYVDEDTDKWHLGAFKYCEFFNSFDILTARVGTDYIVHTFKNIGTTYDQIADLPLPSNIITSGIAYHTQIENDMLRLNLGGLNDRFLTAAPRITKALPRGYSFDERGFVVETILQHECTDDIVWPDGKTGPRLIVSLYTKSRDSDLFDTTNWGLINRHIHHIPKDICWAKISSTFNIDSLRDKETEPWSNFVADKNITELNHKYYSKDVNDMFVQYDLVYPSGQFESKIKFHAVHVKLENALLKSDISETSLFLVTSGEKRERESLPLVVPNVLGILDAGLSLYASGYIPEFTNNLSMLYIDASVVHTDSMPLYGQSAGFIGVDTFFADNIMFGSERMFGNTSPQPRRLGPTLFIAGRTDKYDDQSINLYLENDNRFRFSGAENNIVMFTHAGPINVNASMTLYVDGGLDQTIPSLAISAPLYIGAPVPDPISLAVLPFYVDSINPNIIAISESVGLYTLNYAAINSKLGQLESFFWNKNNVGREIELDDNPLAFLPANDEIRGVKTICYGDCETTIGDTCKELEVKTHDTVWLPTACVDGGIFRALTTYTNPNVSGFKSPDGYDNHFYGIRKFVGLIPQAPYNITITAQTGSDGILEVPREISEWEYGTNNEVDYSGVKIVADNLNRQANDQYGKSVSVKGDLMAIGAPRHTINDADGYELKDAGAIFVYRRLPEPSGFDWTSQPDKSPWELEAKLSLPNGFKRDYFDKVQVLVQNIDGSFIPFPVTETRWKVGQEGRQLGHSVSVCKTDNRELIVAGGPSCLWTRTFDDVVTNRLSIGLFVFTDEFVPSDPNNIFDFIRYNELIYKYFCDPPISFDVKVAICEPVLGTEYDPSEDFDEPKPDFVKKFRINRHTFYVRNSDVFRSKNTAIFNDIKSVFEDMFPYDSGKLNNNIPAMVGFYVDNSVSLGNRALQPALDQFIRYYKEYSFASGLTNVFGNPASGIAHTSLVTQSSLEFWWGDAEDWVSQAAYLMADTLDTGRLISTREFTLFSNNLGTFNPNLPAFNIAPPSGGSVYIFEKEGEDWNIVQEIASPTTSNKVYPDHFGHAVTISDSGNIIVVGSPYINDAVKIYEYNPSAKQYRNAILPVWLKNASDADTNFGELYQLYQKYLNLSRRNASTAVDQIYSEMSPSGKFQFMRQTNVEHYSLIKQYTYQDIDPQSSWPWLTSKFAPTSRLGYSVATNSDGSIVAVGAPTDSMGAQDNANIWWKPGFDNRTTQWQSYVNAGCIRLFEGRDYYPHNKAVEYGKFGNLHRLLNEQSTEDASYFEHFGPIFAARGVGFDRTSFAETEIPQEAGTVFIITPAVDAASDEVIENIQNWLALGDRNLVLVGNDPIWEDDGIYAESNQIINYILERLNSRMRLHPARNRYEARIDDGLEINVLPSFVPAKTTPSFVRSAPLRGSGMADIRLHYPNAFRTYSCEKRDDRITVWSMLDQYVPKYYDSNNKCEMPIIHEGDIRAKWNENLGPNCRGGIVVGEYNLAMFFGTVSPVDWGVCPPREPFSATYQYEPTPILSAAEKVSRTVVYDAIPEQITYEQVPVLVGQTVGGAYPQFASFADSGVAFIWSSTSGNYLDLTTNLGQSTSKSVFFDPLEFNDKDPLIMSRAEVKVETVNLAPDITKTFTYAVREQFEQTTSEVIVLAGTYTENKKVLLSSPNDANLNFYLNIVARDENGSAKIAQLGGWTERTSFVAGYKESYLRNLFNSLGNEVNENISTFNLSLEQNGYDVGWVANTDKLATDEDITRIRSWLAQGKKTLVITYGQNPLAENDSQYISDTYTLASARAAEDLLTRLGFQTKPLFLNSKNKYADKTDARFVDAVDDAYDININQSYAPIARGKSFGLVPSTQIFSFYLANDGYAHDIIPLNNKNSTILADFSTSVVDDSFIERGIPLFKTGIAKVTFPVEPGSGYRVYFTVASETVNENEMLDFRISNCSRNASFNPTEGGFATPIIDYNALDQQITLESPNIGASILKEYIQQRDGTIIVDRTEENRQYRINNFVGRPQVMSIDIQVPMTIKNEFNQVVPASSISIYVDGANVRYRAKEAPDTFRTQRLIAISGALLPIDTVLTYQNVIRYDTVEKIIPAVSERIVTTEYFREIHTSSEKYCPSDGCRDNFLPVPEIADGPVVAAQEIYHQKPFDAGVNRSRITLISDASIIQGRSIALPNGNIIGGLDTFLGSTYPFTSFPQQNGGRQYTYIRKIVSPERTSPQKLIAAYNKAGLTMRFNGGGSGGGGTSLSFSDLDNLINGGDVNYAPPLQPEVGRANTYMFLRDFPIIEPELIEAEKRNIIARFDSAQYNFGGTAKFSGVIDGVAYADASVYGGMPQLMIDKGYDYLDFDKMPSGYPGDLFGYSVAIKDDKIFVGAPFAVFSGEDITTWTQVQQNTPTGALYNAQVGFNGGAGAVYMFEKNNLGIGPLGANTPWSCTRKFRPNSINIGQDISNTELSQAALGTNTYSSQFLQDNSIISDKFGLSVSIDGDVLAISAPGHDFGSIATQTSGQFIRKEFNEQFHIPTRSNYDLGSTSIRNNYFSDNIPVLNMGAIYTYENKISNWGAKTQSWTLAQKLVPQGYLSQAQGQSENSMFGQSISIDRTRRKDGDYTLVVGSPQHDHGNSGDASLANAGAAYTYDAMLRKLRPSFAHPDTFIAGRVFGDVTIENPYTYFEFKNDYKYSERLYLDSVVFANNQGEIFIEASGQDKIPKGYITHRPFIEQIRGSFLFGTPSEYYTRLYVEGRPPERFSTIPLINQASESANVYNLLGLYNNAVLGIVSGVPSFNLYTSGNYVDFAEASGMPLCVSGVELNSDIMNLYVKGKF